jgi:hypothetical protein
MAPEDEKNMAVGVGVHRKAFPANPIYPKAQFEVGKLTEGLGFDASFDGMILPFHSVR